jgi:hypothetical protein
MPFCPDVSTYCFFFVDGGYSGVVALEHDALIYSMMLYLD